MAKIIDTYERAAKLLGKKSRGAKVATGFTIVPANPERTAIDLYAAYRIKDIYEKDKKHHYKPELRIFPDSTYVFPAAKASDQSMAQFANGTLPFYIQGIKYQMTLIAPNSSYQSVVYRGMAYREGKLLTPIVPHVRRAEEHKKEFAAARRKLSSFIKFAEAMKAWEDPAIRDAEGPGFNQPKWVRPFDLGMMSRYTHNDEIAPRFKELKQHFLKAFLAHEYDETCLKIAVQTGRPAKVIDWLAEMMAWEMDYYLTATKWLKREHPDFNGDSWWEHGRGA